MTRRVLSLTVLFALLLTMILPPVTASAATLKILKVNADYARMRTGPNSSYSLVRNLRKGERVFYMNTTSGSFCKVRTSRGETGYVYKGYLSYYGAVKSSQVYIANSGATVYKKANTSSGKVAYLSSSMYVLVGGISGNWAYVKSMTGKTGYIQTKYLKKAS